MEIQLLGTGSADGWPNPFCLCSSCEQQKDLIRTPTSLLIDQRLLVDCGPETPRQALRFGARLDQLEAVLITHAHQDHCAPQFLLHRSWVTDRQLQVAGPEPVIEMCTPWLAPDQQQVSWINLRSRVEVEVGGYRVKALPANHFAQGEALLYRITDPRGVSILYATDTGRLPRKFEEILGTEPLDAVFLEQTFGDGEATLTHHNFSLFKASLDRLRAAGPVNENTQIFAVHLSHRNPPEAELTARLAALGAQPGQDGQTIILGIH